MARDEEKDMQYIVTSNLPGYLPDEDPGEPMDFETAKMALKDELQHSYNSLGEPEEEAETLAGILVMVDDLTEFACEGGLNIHFGDWVHSLTAVES